jgi:DNA invertase Pin-like site-specific DNA recombinase
MLKTAIYIRVSTLEQSTDLQRQDLLNLAKARGWDDIAVYEDNGKTGTNGNRQQLQYLLADCRAGRVKRVLIWKLDRLFRSLRHLITTIHEFETLGVELVSLKDQIDLTTPSGRLMVQIIGAMGEFEAALIKERVKAGLKHAKSRGVVLGRKQVIDIARAKQMRAAGQSLSEIGNHFGITKQGVAKALKKT